MTDITPIAATDQLVNTPVPEEDLIDVKTTMIYADDLSSPSGVEVSYQDVRSGSVMLLPYEPFNCVGSHPPSLMNRMFVAKHDNAYLTMDMRLHADHWVQAYVDNCSVTPHLHNEVKPLGTLPPILSTFDSLRLCDSYSLICNPYKKVVSELKYPLVYSGNGMSHFIFPLDPIDLDKFCEFLAMTTIRSYKCVYDELQSFVSRQRNARQTFKCI